MIKVGISTASDKGAAEQRIDESGKVIMNTLDRIDASMADYVIVPDDKETIAANLIRTADIVGVNLILTTGGTGFSPRDITPEATLSVIDREAPGIPEAMRLKSLQITPKAMLSRAVAGLRGKTLIINLPGSPKAVSECLEVIVPVLPHAIEILRGDTGECAG